MTQLKLITNFSQTAISKSRLATNMQMSFGKSRVSTTANKATKDVFVQLLCTRVSCRRLVKPVPACRQPPRTKGE